MHQTDTSTDGDGADGADGARTTRHVDEGDDALLEAVIEAVAAETGQGPFEMEPLYHTLGSTELRRVLDLDSGSDRLDGVVRFRYESCEVTVTDDGRVTAARRAGGRH